MPRYLLERPFRDGLAGAGGDPPGRRAHPAAGRSDHRVRVLDPYFHRR